MNPFVYILKLIGQKIVVVLLDLLDFFGFCNVDNLILGVLFIQINLVMIDSRDLSQVDVG